MSVISATNGWASTRGDPVCDSHGSCITCGDDALPMWVRRIDGDRGLALCADRDGRLSSVETALVEPVAIGDELLVHAGTAIGRTS